MFGYALRREELAGTGVANTVALPPAVRLQGVKVSTGMSGL